MKNIKSFFKKELNISSDDVSKGQRKEIYLIEATVFAISITIFSLILNVLKVKPFQIFDVRTNVIIEFIACFAIFYVIERIIIESKIKKEV